MTTVLDTAQSYPGFEPLSDADFARDMDERVVPFVNRLRKAHTLKTENGKDIYCETLVPDVKKVRGLIVLFHGFCEFCSKFDEFTYYILQQGYALCRFDEFGHGFSGREIDDSSKVHIERFQTYVDCAYEVVIKIAEPLAAELGKMQNNGKALPLLLFSHSMGGAVAALFLEQHPSVFTAAVLASPMLEFFSKKRSQNTAHILVKMLRVFGKGKTYFPGQKKFDGTYSFSAEKTLTCSKNRFLYHFNKRHAQARYQTWGGTVAWLDESIKALNRIFKKKALKKICDPILVFQAEKDTTVSNGGQNRFVEAIPSARLAVCPGANHELYNGTDETLRRWYPELFKFYDEFSK